MRTETPKQSSLDRVRAAALSLGLAIEIRTMDQSTRTAEDAARACGCEVAQIVKSLVFVNAEDDTLVLLLVSGGHNADLRLIRETHGLKLERCDGRRVRDETGFAIGGVAPVGHVKPVPVYFDEALLAYDTVWAAAGRPDSVFRVDSRELARVTTATVLRVA
jgi:prolyl-tRNA editing enzyme YbaK/EbsC (Cys-tRNA(Pro) deacylase)